jgi:Tfp pilus assembly protein PilZ
MSLGIIQPHPGDEIRRRAQRSGRAGVEIAVDLHGVDGPLPGVTRNISPDGAFVVTPTVMAVGERLMLMLAFPGDRGLLAVRAEVRWTRRASSSPDDRQPAGMGLRFVDPPLGVVLAIADLVESERLRGAPIG